MIEVLTVYPCDLSEIQLAGSSADLLAAGTVLMLMFDLIPPGLGFGVLEGSVQTLPGPLSGRIGLAPGE